KTHFAAVATPEAYIMKRCEVGRNGLTHGAQARWGEMSNDSPWLLQADNPETIRRRESGPAAPSAGLYRRSVSSWPSIESRGNVLHSRGRGVVSDGGIHRPKDR